MATEKVFILALAECTHVDFLHEAIEMAQERANSTGESHYVYQNITAGSDTHVPARLLHKIDPIDAKYDESRAISR